MHPSPNIDPPTLENNQRDVQLPIGYRFIPTDEELVVHYLKNKVLCRNVPANVGQDIEGRFFYSRSPTHLVTISNGEREWYFFIHEEENSPRNGSTIRKVENELGVWKKVGEKWISNPEGEVSAIKYRFIYFSQQNDDTFKKTHWRMDEYQLPSHVYAENNVQGMIVLGKLMRGLDYNICDDFA